MGLTLSYIDQKLNPFAASFRVSADQMGRVGKIVFMADGTYKQYSNLAQQLLIKAVRRVDMSAEKGSTIITASNTVMPWDARSIRNIGEIIVSTLSRENVINEQAIVKNVPLLKPFHAASNTIQGIVEKTFHEKVSPSLISHGGAMELTNISVSGNGEIVMEIALMGSCQECKGAETITVKAAEMHANEMLSYLREQHPGDKNVQALTIGKSRIQTVSDIAFERI